MNQDLTKQCPRCGKTQTYTRFDHYREAVKKNRLCLSCVSSIRWQDVNLRNEFGSAVKARWLKADFRKKALKTPLSNDEYISRAKAIHGDRFDYSITQYRGVRYPIKVICRKHGEFQCRPANHLHGTVCYKCRHDSWRNETSELLNCLKAKHGDRYEFDLKDYKNRHSKIEVTCSKHGKFKARYNDLVKAKVGCKQCVRESRTSQACKEFLDYLEVMSREQNVLSGKYCVDGIDYTTNTVFEFHGDLWHSNPQKFNPFEVNKMIGVLNMEVHMKTFVRMRELVEAGYTVKYIWEQDWLKFKKGIDAEPNIKTFKP